jgi:hypothetical protein
VSFGAAANDQSSKEGVRALESSVVWLRSGGNGNWVPVTEKETASDSTILFGNVRIATILIDPCDKSNLDRFIASRAKRIGLDEKSPRDLSGGDNAKPSDEFDFPGLDSNADQKLQWDEYRSAWYDRASVCSPLVRFHTAFHSDRIVALIDRNLDQVLSSKEVQDAARQLANLKRGAQPEQDTAQLFPESLLIVATRFLVSENQPLANSLELIEERTRIEPLELPEWFRAMDSNSDGEISSVEFIGPMEKFQTADQNQNGVIEGSELITKP